MKNIVWDTRLKFITGMIVTAALCRIIPHPYNFTPIGAMALFGGCYISNKRLAFLIPLGAMLAIAIFPYHIEYIYFNSSISFHFQRK